uniref:Brinker DNA-binding domain-containing protein n=1 Tax=Latimeria chalumnae TaxID=7897 RepID=H3AKT5_LATCH
KMKKKVSLKYDAGFKLRVVEYAEQSNNCIMEKMVSAWRKMKEALKEMPKTKRAHYGHMQSFAALEVDLNEWVLQSGHNGYIVTRNWIMTKEEKYKTDGSSTFIAFAGWCTCFMEIHRLTMPQQANMMQKLLKDLEMKVCRFLKFAIKLWKEHNYHLLHISNIDETSMTFDLPCNRTVNPFGSKAVLVKTTGHEKIHFTVVLTCLADGSKLKPLIIFKCKTLSKVLVRLHPKGWMDEEGNTWLKKVWNTHCKCSMLVWDMFRAHIINRQRKMWTQWICCGSSALTKDRNLKKPNISLICKWMKDTWESIPEQMIHHSFLKCGISNATDGSQD